MEITQPLFLFLIPPVLMLGWKKNIFAALSAAFLLTALSGISKVETKKIKVPNQDVIFVIDTTYSMAAEDLKPNRLEYAKKELIKIIKKLNIPVGAISFSKGVNLLSLPTLNHNKLIEKIKKLKPQKSRTDILMAINAAKNLSDSKKTIVLVSDGGERKINDDFIFWGFATKKGAKVPGYDAVTKLNEIGKVKFAYNQSEKLLSYLQTHKNYSIKEVKIKKPVIYPFVILSFISFALGVLVKKISVIFAVIFIVINPQPANANDFFGCLYEYLGIKKDPFKNSQTDFGLLKHSIYLIEHKEYHKALQSLSRIKGYEKEKTYLKALVLTKLQRYNQAYKEIKKITSYEDKNIQKLYNFLKNLKQDKAEVIPVKKPQNTSKAKKEHEW